MNECDELIDDLHGQASDQLQLALIATVAPVAGMHLDLAIFAEEQARVVEEICDDE